MSAKLLPGEYTGSKLEAYKEEQVCNLLLGEAQSSQDGQTVYDMQDLNDAVCMHDGFEVALNDVLLRGPEGLSLMMEIRDKCAKDLIESLHK